MDDEYYVQVFNWAITELTVAERTKTLQKFWHHIAPLIKPGMRVLDLCCGSGAAAFLLADIGAQVTAIDSSPLLIEQGQTENSIRKASVNFIQADVLDYRFEQGSFDLAVVLGNPILDFPPDRFGKFCDGVAHALKPGARIVLEYFDGVENCLKWADPPERITEHEPEEIAMRFTGYDAQLGAFSFRLHNRTRDEYCSYQGYVYTIPLLRQLLKPQFVLDESYRLADWKFLDVFVKQEQSKSLQA
jgi:SAM-dependent methyltransferase